MEISTFQLIPMDSGTSCCHMLCTGEVLRLLSFYTQIVGRAVVQVMGFRLLEWPQQLFEHLMLFVICFADHHGV